MTHQAEIEKRKYRNWVRGGLAYKYLKQGLEDFADDVVKQEHGRILAAINHTPGTCCNLCCLRNLQPIHTCKRDYDGKKMCPYGLFNCDCLHGKKQRCPANICDGIMEEILKSHESKPPQPYWRNTDIQKWCKEPWEVAKCFINAPGYSDKTNAADIDISGLLHVFINNKKLHSHLACSMAGNNIFIEVRDTRNKLFHSATMEMEERDMFKCIDDIVEILEDPKELKGRPKAQQAVNKLKQLKQNDFSITTHNVFEVRREALAYVTLNLKQFEQTVQDANNDISNDKKDMVERLQQAAEKHKKDVKDVIDQETDIAKETIHKSLHKAVKEVDNHSEILNERVKKLEADLSERVEKMETRVSERLGKLETDVSERVGKLEELLGKLVHDCAHKCQREMLLRPLSVEMRQHSSSSLKLLDRFTSNLRVTSLAHTVEESDCIRHMFEKRLDYVKGKQELQDNLVKFYQQYYVKTSLSPLTQQQDSVNSTDMYVHPEIVVIEEINDLDRNARETARELNVAEEEQVLSLHNSIQKLDARNLDELSFESAINQLLAKNILHTLHQLRKLTLKNMDIDDNVLTVTPEMKRLTYIELENTTLSLNTWHTFVDSLLTLNQLIHVKVHFKERAKELNDYVLSKQKFKVLYDFKFGIYFRSDVSAYSSRSCFFGLCTLTTNSI